MKTVLRSVTMCAFVFGLSVSLIAAPQEGKQAGKKKAEAKAAALPAGMYKLPETITLTAEQKTKLAAIQKEYTPKFRAIAKKNMEILTQEQRQARRKATQEARAAGKKQKEIQAAVEAAIKPSDEQKAQLAKVREESTKLRSEMETKVVALLTPEQKAELPKKGKGKGKGKARNKKAAA